MNDDKVAAIRLWEGQEVESGGGGVAYRGNDGMIWTKEKRGGEA